MRYDFDLQLIVLLAIDRSPSLETLTHRLIRTKNYMKTHVYAACLVFAMTNCTDRAENNRELLLDDPPANQHIVPTSFDDALTSLNAARDMHALELDSSCDSGPTDDDIARYIKDVATAFFKSLDDAHGAVHAERLREPMTFPRELSYFESGGTQKWVDDKNLVYVAVMDIFDSVDDAGKSELDHFELVIHRSRDAGKVDKAGFSKLVLTQKLAKFFFDKAVMGYLQKVLDAIVVDGADGGGTDADAQSDPYQIGTNKIVVKLALLRSMEILGELHKSLPACLSDDLKKKLRNVRNKLSHCLHPDALGLLLRDDDGGAVPLAALARSYQADGGATTIGPDGSVDDFFRFISNDIQAIDFFIKDALNELSDSGKTIEDATDLWNRLKNQNNAGSGLDAAVVSAHAWKSLDIVKSKNIICAKNEAFLEHHPPTADHLLTLIQYLEDIYGDAGVPALDLDADVNHPPRARLHEDLIEHLLQMAATFESLTRAERLEALAYEFLVNFFYEQASHLKPDAGLDQLRNSIGVRHYYAHTLMLFGKTLVVNSYSSDAETSSKSAYATFDELANAQGGLIYDVCAGGELTDDDNYESYDLSDLDAARMDGAKAYPSDRDGMDMCICVGASYRALMKEVGLLRTNVKSILQRRVQQP